MQWLHSQRQGSRFPARISPPGILCFDDLDDCIFVGGNPLRIAGTRCGRGLPSPGHWTIRLAVTWWSPSLPGFDRRSKPDHSSPRRVGYDAIYPNLFWREAPGVAPNDAAATARAQGGAPPDDPLAGAGAMGYFRARPTANDNMASIGFCSGGLAACARGLTARPGCRHRLLWRPRPPIKRNLTTDIRDHMSRYSDCSAPRTRRRIRITSPSPTGFLPREWLPA